MDGREHHLFNRSSVKKEFYHTFSTLFLRFNIHNPLHKPERMRSWTRQVFKTNYPTENTENQQWTSNGISSSTKESIEKKTYDFHVYNNSTSLIEREREFQRAEMGSLSKSKHESVAVSQVLDPSRWKPRIIQNFRPIFSPPGGPF